MNIKVNKYAKAYAEDSITIQASAEKVYSILSDINNWTTWLSNVVEPKLEGPPEEEKEFTWIASGLKIKSTLHTVIPNSAFGWTGKMLWISAIHNWSLSEENGICTVHVEESMEGFLAGTMKSTMIKSMKKGLIGLKTESEKSE